MGKVLSERSIEFRFGERWLHTGDIGYVDEDGVVFVTGRIKRIIMTKGEDGQVSLVCCEM